MGYKTICPECAGDNFYVTPENGKSYCFNCGYFHSEGRVTPPKRSDHITGIRTFYNEIAAFYSSALLPEHYAWLERRGIAPTEAQRLRIGYVPTEAHMLYYGPVLPYESGLVYAGGTPHLRGRIVFPYLVKGTVTDMRGRTYDTEDERKYLSPFHSGFYRGADYPYNHDLLAQHSTIVITEGEIKSILSNLVDVPCVALPGIQSMRPMLKQRHSQRFVVCFDMPYTSEVIRAIYKLGGMFDTVSVATLPTHEHTKMDIDTYILTYGELAYKRVINRAIPFDTWRTMIRY